LASLTVQVFTGINGIIIHYILTSSGEKGGKNSRSRNSRAKTVEEGEKKRKREREPADCNSMA
jgi:hypothetical protein